MVFRPDWQCHFTPASTMKILLFYMSHRQFREIGISAEFAKRFTGVLREADVLLYCNNTEIPKGDLESMLARFPNANRELVHTSKNWGYFFGGMEATADCYAKFLNPPYDWVIHIQTDVFVTDEEKLSPRSARPTNTARITLPRRCLRWTRTLIRPTFSHGNPRWFPPRCLNLTLIIQNRTQYPRFFHDMIHRFKIPYDFIIRYRGRGWMREIDLLGLWHLHNCARAEFYLRTGIYVPLGEYKTVENFFRRLYRSIFPKPPAAPRPRPIS